MSVFTFFLFDSRICTAQHTHTVSMLSVSWQRRKTYHQTNLVCVCVFISFIKFVFYFVSKRKGDTCCCRHIASSFVHFELTDTYTHTYSAYIIYSTFIVRWFFIASKKKWRHGTFISFVVMFFGLFMISSFQVLNFFVQNPKKNIMKFVLLSQIHSKYWNFMMYRMSRRHFCNAEKCKQKILNCCSCWMCVCVSLLFATWCTIHRNKIIYHLDCIVSRFRWYMH